MYIENMVHTSAKSFEWLSVVSLQRDGFHGDAEVDAGAVVNKRTGQRRRRQRAVVGAAAQTTAQRATRHRLPVLRTRG